MVQRIVLNNATGRMLKCNTLLKNLQVFTNRQPIGENFKNLQKTLQYA